MPAEFSLIWYLKHRFPAGHTGSHLYHTLSHFYMVSTWLLWWLLEPPPSKTLVCPVMSSMLCVILSPSIFLVVLFFNFGFFIVFLKLLCSIGCLLKASGKFSYGVLNWFLNIIHLLCRKTSVIIKWSLEMLSSRQLTGPLVYRN